MREETEKKTAALREEAAVRVCATGGGYSLIVAFTGR